MATNSVKVTLQIRHDEAQDWVTRNPVLAQGEYGLETDTFLIKVGDGVRDWQHLPYLNRLDASYFKFDATNNQYTFSDDFMNKIHTLEAAAGEAITQLIVTEPPVNDFDVPNKKYVDESEKNYKNAVELSQNISWINPIKLGLYLNYSVFFYEIKKDAKKAIQIAKEAIKSAKKYSDKIKEEEDKDAEITIQILKENINYWEED